MNLTRILFSFVSVSGLGILFGIGLAIASRLLAVKKNELVEHLEAVLPGLNCGACGYAGCSGYAEAISLKNSEADDEVSLTLCTPGGPETARELSEIVGVEVDLSMQKRVTQVHCKGGRGIAKTSFLYTGVKDCNALHAMYGGDKTCPYGCLGLGSCIAVCPVDAISYDANGLVWVDKEECISCGKCVDICPTDVMQWVPYDADLMVACNSLDKASVVRKYCSVGCIGCKICERKSPEGGFVVENFLARIEYKAEGGRNEAAAACPPKCIIANNSITAEK